MKASIRERFDPLFAQEAAERFNIDPTSIVEMEGFESFIFSGNRDKVKVVLRLAHSMRRSPDMICAELDYMTHLAHGGASVSKPLLSLSQTWVEAIDDTKGGQFLASCFTWAEGSPPNEREHHTDAFLEAYGRVLGQMHRLVQDYTPKETTWRRPRWDDPSHLDMEGWLEGNHPRVLEAFNTLHTATKTLETAPTNFNLIHQDVHMSNFHVTEDDRMTVFDFDDCGYGFFVHDLAIVLYHALPSNNGERADFTRGFLPPLLRGYQEQYPLDAELFRHIPLFLAIRRIELYAVVHRSMKVKLETEKKWQAWAAKLHGEILANTPVVELDFMEFVSNNEGSVSA